MEVSDGGKSSQQLPVEQQIALLCDKQFPREEGEGCEGLIKDTM
jgi:hypothetical protein